MNQSRFRKSTSTLAYIFSVLKRASLSLTVAFILLSLVGGLTMLIELWAMTHFIDQITLYAGSGWTVSSKEIAVHTLPWIGAFVGAMLLHQFISSLQPYLSEQLNERTSSHLKRDLFEKSMRLRLESFESEVYNDQLELSRKVVQRDLARVLNETGNAISAIVQLAVIVYSVFQIGLFYAVVLLLCLVPIVYYNIKGSKRFNEVNYSQSPVRRKQAYWRNAATSREGAAELRLFNLGPLIIGKWKEQTKALISELLQTRKSVELLQFKSQIGYLVLLFAMMATTVFAGIQETLSLGAAVATLYMLDRLERVKTQITFSLDEITQILLRFQVVPQFMGINDEDDYQGMTPLSRVEEICFENVSFTYPGQQQPALSQISFRLRRGERIALAGENGAGKSTLCLLLLGLYQPTKGRILINGINSTELDPIAWRNQAAAVFQNYMRFPLTAHDNIAFGAITDLIDEEKVKYAAKLSGIHAAIDRLPGKYRTLLGKQYEESRDLSGGEWQKVAIARAYFREAQFLILDEPAAALDAHSEYQVYKQFSELSEGKTVVIVSHRLGSARLANRIFMLKSGRIVESGSHEQLLKDNGEYASLFQMQAQWYKEDSGKGEESLGDT